MNESLEWLKLQSWIFFNPDKPCQG